MAMVTRGHWTSRPLLLLLSSAPASVVTNHGEVLRDLAALRDERAAVDHVLQNTSALHELMWDLAYGPIFRD
eukprot:gene23814-51604_t